MSRNNIYHAAHDFVAFQLFIQSENATMCVYVVLHIFICIAKGRAHDCEPLLTGRARQPIQLSFV